VKLSDYRDSYYFYSGKTSDVARQLAFAGIALVWIFKQNGQPIPIIPKQLLLPSFLLTLALTFDLLHYAVASLIWGGFARYHEKQGKTQEEDLLASRFWNWPGLFFFWVKVAFVIVAYGFIFKFVFFYWYSAK